MSTETYFNASTAAKYNQVDHSTEDPRIKELPAILNDPLLLKYGLVPFDDPVKLKALQFGMLSGPWYHFDHHGQRMSSIRQNNTAISHWYRQLHTPGEVALFCLPRLFFDYTWNFLSCYNHTVEYEHNLIAQHTFSYQYGKYKTDILTISTLSGVIMMFGIFGKSFKNIYSILL